ncbi:MAG: hypothetical protein GX443_15475 [Deltaproteobacteria bacterium]|nr:hypothetical protein [Deltaproteobacteria bacterium]
MRIRWSSLKRASTAVASEMKLSGTRIVILTSLSAWNTCIPFHRHGDPVHHLKGGYTRLEG